jgi:mannose-6-phosphate isomerase
MKIYVVHNGFVVSATAYSSKPLRETVEDLGPNTQIEEIEAEENNEHDFANVAGYLPFDPKIKYYFLLKEFEGERPWGNFKILADEDAYKSKKITVKPGARLSYQSHKLRSEVWTIVSGTGKITLDGIISPVTPGSVWQIPVEVKHRIENDGQIPLVFIEVQLGTSFAESDIIRYQDDFGRDSS